MERLGDAEARKVAKAQGVPFSPASTGTSASVARKAEARNGGRAKKAKAPEGATPAAEVVPLRAITGEKGRRPPGGGKWTEHDAMELAVFLHLTDGDEEGAALLRGGPAPAELVGRARKHKDLLEGNPGALGRLAFANLALALIRLQRERAEVAIGAVSQLVKPMKDLWSEVAGGTAASDITLVFELDEGEPEPEATGT